MCIRDSFSGLVGFQGVVSTVQSVTDLGGQSLDAGGSIAPEGAGLAAGTDYSFGATGSSATFTNTVTVGAGFGGRGHAGSATFTIVKPFC